MTYNFTRVRQTEGFPDKGRPVQVISGSKIYYIYLEQVGSAYQIFTATSDLDGSNFVATQRVFNTPSCDYPDLCVDDGVIYYVWTQHEGTGGYYQIWTASMNIDGTGWVATKRTTSLIHKRYSKLTTYSGKLYYCYLEGSSYTLFTASMNVDGTGWTSVDRAIGCRNWDPSISYTNGKILYAFISSVGGYDEVLIATAGLDGSNFAIVSQTQIGSQDIWNVQQVNLTVYNDLVCYAFRAHTGHLFFGTTDLNGLNLVYQQVSYWQNGFEDVVIAVRNDIVYIVYTAYDSSWDMNQFWLATGNILNPVWELQALTEFDGSRYYLDMVYDGSKQLCLAWEEADVTWQDLQLWTGTIVVSTPKKSFFKSPKADPSQGYTISPKHLVQLPPGYSFWGAQSKIIDNAVYTYSLLSYRDSASVSRIELFFSKHSLDGVTIIPLTQLTDQGLGSLWDVTGVNVTVYNNKLYWFYRTNSSSYATATYNRLYFATSELDGSNFQTQDIAGTERGYNMFIEVINGSIYLAWDELIYSFSPARQAGKVARLNLDGSGYYEYPVTWPGDNEFQGIANVNNVPCVVVLSNGWKDLRFILPGVADAPTILVLSHTKGLTPPEMKHVLVLNNNVFIGGTTGVQTSFVLGASIDGTGLVFVENPVPIKYELEYYSNMASYKDKILLVHHANIPDEDPDYWEHPVYVFFDPVTKTFGDYTHTIMPDQTNVGDSGGWPGYMPGVIDDKLLLVYTKWTENWTYENFFLSQLTPKVSFGKGFKQPQRAKSALFTGGYLSSGITTRKYDKEGGELLTLNHTDGVRGIAVDSRGNIITAGHRTTDNITTRKYDKDGNQLWAVDHGNHLWDLVVDENDNIYTTGYRTTTDYMTTRKYDKDGNLLWSADHGTHCYSMTIDPVNGHIYTGGYKIGVDNNTIRKYDYDGNLLWLKGASGSPHGLKVHETNLYVASTGYSVGLDVCSLTKYDIVSGDILAYLLLNGGTMLGVDVDMSGFIYVGGYKSADKTTHKLNPDGSLVWSVNHGDNVVEIIVDGDGNVYTGGVRNINTGYMSTRKYNNDGALLWSVDHGNSVLCVRLGQGSGLDGFKTLGSIKMV